MQRLGLSDKELDDRIRALEWALRRAPSEIAQRVPGRNLWVAVTPVGLPMLRVFLRPHPDELDQVEWMWIEERL